MTPALPWALALLDDGLRLYRRHVLSFLAVAGAIQIPLAILGLLMTTLIQTQLGEAWVSFGVLLQSLIQYPVWLLSYAALSRAAAAALDGQPIRIGAVLRLGPGRLIGMGCYNLIFTMIFGSLASIMVLAIVCPLLYTSIFSAGLLGRFGGNGTLGAAGGLFGVLLILLLVWIVVIFGATVASQVYALQAFALERRPFGATLSRSIDLLTFKLGRTLLVFLGAGAIGSTIVAAYTGTIVAGGAALFRLLDIQLPPTASQALQTSLITLTGVVLLPPLPIWMAMLHRGLARERDGNDLRATVETWQARVTTETQP
jgi:hypothetical protein